MLEPAALVGCGAGGVLGGGRELETGTAVAVWAGSFGGEGSATPFHATLTDDGVEQTIEGLPDPEDSSGMLLLSDPYSFPTDAALALLCDAAPGVPILGGISSGRTPDGQGAVFSGDEVHESGAVGVRLDGIEMLACVSQGAAPLGREVTITAVRGQRDHTSSPDGRHSRPSSTSSPSCRRESGRWWPAAC